MKSGDCYPMTIACWRLHQLALSPEQAEPSMMISSAKVRCGNTDRGCFNVFSAREAGLFATTLFSMTHYDARCIGHVFEDRLAKRSVSLMPCLMHLAEVGSLFWL